ncbi:MAG: Ca-activated chloride channel family protein [Cognaticolwellia sp.]|jgi:Ca-activated chloride channel family protein
MLSLQDPWFLLALPSVPLALWWARQGRARIQVASLAQVEIGWSLRGMLAWLPVALRGAGLILLIGALARPQRTRQETVVESDGLDILLAIDTSETMDARDLSTQRTRMDLARDTSMAFVEGRPYDRIGLVVFGEEAFTQVPLTMDHQALLQILGQIQIGLAGGRATAIGHAIAVSGRHLADLDSESKVLVLMTDGKNTVRTPPEPLVAAEAAAILGVRIYTIGVGAPSKRAPGIVGMMGGRTPDGIDEPMLRRIAQGSGGRFYRAARAEDLTEIFAEIDALETTTAELTLFVHRKELAHWLLGPALMLLALELLLSSTWLRRLP